MCKDVCEAMEYLESKQFLHRDLVGDALLNSPREKTQVNVFGFVMDKAWMTCDLPDVAAGQISVTLANVPTGTGFWSFSGNTGRPQLLPPTRVKMLSGTLNLMMEILELG